MKKYVIFEPEIYFSGAQKPLENNGADSEKPYE